MIHGTYFKDEEVIRWGLYVDDNTVANYVLELDLITGDVRDDPQYYPHRYLDVFTYGNVRGRNYVGQFGWTGGKARLGLDNVPNRFSDWVSTFEASASGTLAIAGQTATVLTISAGAITTVPSGLVGMQVMIWRETDAGNDRIANRTYYHCRISDNTSTTFTINYVESMNCVGIVTSVASALPAVPSGAGWQYRIGVIQSVVGPKWFPGKNPETRGTFRDITILHKAKSLSASTEPVVALGFENFDGQPREAQLLEMSQEGEQVSDATKTAASFNFPKTNPVAIHGFALHENNVNPAATTGMDIEAVVLNFNEAVTQGAN
jgi:hypothetical protein